MLSAAALIARANQIAKCDLYDEQGLDGLNAILSDLCEQHDLAKARALFTFNFQPSLVSRFGSGPYPMPLDYLRTSGSSGAEGVTKSAWFLYPTPSGTNQGGIFDESKFDESFFDGAGSNSGVPLPLVPMDLGEYDQYPILDSQGLPSSIATDMGGPLTQRIVLSTTASLTLDSPICTVASTAKLAAGLAMAGEGITPGTTIDTVVNATQLTLSAAATATLSAASVFFGIAPVAYVYPAPVGAYPVFIRYQRQMPPIVDTSRMPWFPSEGFLIEKLAAYQMAITDDARKDVMEASAERKLGKFLALKDDTTNRAQTVQFDARYYGRGMGNRLRITKVAGW